MYFSLIFYLKKLVFFCIFLKMDTFSRSQLHNSPLESIYIYRYYPVYITLLYPYLHIYYTLLVHLQQDSRIIFNKQSYWQILCRIKSQTLIVLACISLMVICCRKLFLLLWERKTFTCVKYAAKIQKPIQKFIANSSQKLLSEHSF